MHFMQFSDDTPKLAAGAIQRLRLRGAGHYSLDAYSSAD